MTRFVGMIANQRSGTHLLRECFNSHPDVVCPPEPLYWSAPGTAEGMVEFLRRFEGEERVVVLDVKYNQITPPVEDFLQGVPVLHLVRRDIKRMYFSRVLRIFYQHHATVEEREQACKGRFVRLRVSDEAYDSYEWRVEKMRKRYSYLADLVVFYEAMTNNREVKILPEPWSGVLCAFLGVEGQALSAETGKGSPANVDDYMTIGRLPIGVVMERWV